MLYYCQFCGNPNPYVNCKKPNFCNNCGKSMNVSLGTSVLDKKASIKTINHPTHRTLDVYDDESPEEYVPSVDKLNFQIEGADIEGNVQTLEDVIFNNPLQPKKRPRRPRKKVAKDAFAQIMSQAKGGTRVELND